MKAMLKWLRQLWSGKPMTPEERKAEYEMRKHAKICMLGAGTAGMKVEADGKIHIEELHSGGDEVRDNPDS